MTRKLIIATTFFRRRWWRVVIHSSLEDLREAAHRHRPGLGRDHWSDIEGCCHPAGRADDNGTMIHPVNGYGGIVRYAEPSLTSEIVAHELVHAAVATLRGFLPGRRDVRLGDGWRGNAEREEQLAYIYGDLFADLDRQL